LIKCVRLFKYKNIKKFEIPKFRLKQPLTSLIVYFAADKTLGDLNMVVMRG